MNLDVILFAIFAIGAVASAIYTVTRRNPVAAAMSLIGHFFMLAGLYLTLHAQFVAVVQVLVYAGAIMVLVVFVIMLLNLGNEQQLSERISMRTTLGTLMAGLFAVQVVTGLMARPTGMMQQSSEALTIGATASIGNALFTTYIFPFEAVSILLLAALIGAVVLAKRHLQEGA